MGARPQGGGAGRRGGGATQCFDQESCENDCKVPSARSNKSVTHAAVHRRSAASSVDFLSQHKDARTSRATEL